MRKPRRANATPKRPKKPVQTPANSPLPATRWIELRNNDGEPVGALVPLGKRDSQKFRAYLGLESLDTRFKLRRSRLNPLIVDQLASASSTIQAALRAGQVYQVVGPPHLVRGLKRGTYEMIRSKGGFLGTAVRKGSSKFSDQVRFLPKSPTSIVAPLVAYQILHAIAGTTELRNITERLDALERGLRNLQLRHEAETLGRIRWAISALDDLFEEHASTGEFSPEMILRLSHIEMAIGSLLERTHVLVETFRSKAQQASQQSGKQGAKATTTLLSEEGTQAHMDMQVLVGLTTADLRVQEARIRCAMEHAPGDVARRMEQAGAKVSSYRAIVTDLPSIKALVDHAQSCLRQMSWFSRNVTARGIVEEVRAVKGLDLKDLSSSGTDPFQDVPASYVLWLDENGNPQACVVDKLTSEAPANSG